MNNLPKARTENLLEQNLEKETLIYDLNIDKAFNLNETLTIVYKACGQNQAFEDLKHKYKFTDDFIYLALDELKRNNLLAEEYRSPFANTNRREVIKKVGLATMFALPIITGLVAPKAVNAASDTSQGGCVNDSQCNGGVCVGGTCFQRVEGACGNGADCVTAFCDFGYKKCCVGGQGSGAILLLSGQTASPSNNGADYPQYLPLNTPSYTSCAGQVICCDGRAASGGCTYTRVGDEVITGADGTPYGNFSYSCTCTCPA